MKTNRNATFAKTALGTLATLAVSAFSTLAAAQIIFYENQDFTGRTFTTSAEVTNFTQYGYNDRASSAVVQRGRWEICEDARFGGRCTVLRPGRYPSLSAMSLNNQISSTRILSGNSRGNDIRYAPTPPAGQITFYENDGFRGRSFTTENQLSSFERQNFNDRASSVVVTRDVWEVCEDIWYGGRCVTLRPGRYGSLSSMGLSDQISSARIVSYNERPEDYRYPPVSNLPTLSQVTFYENNDFQGRTFTTRNQVDNFERYGFNDLASSVVVEGEAREVCEDENFGGRCAILRPGRYPSLADSGLNDRISSVRLANANLPVRYDDNRYNYQRRNNERLYDARVTSVRAVVGAPEQRCWIEREQVSSSQTQDQANVPGAIVGSILGGILGHQVGGGRGKDLATAGGAIAGLLVGSKVGQDGNNQEAYTQNVQRCANTPSQSRPAYWDVTYEFRNQEYRMQMTNPPGATVTVNEQGEPRTQ
jgi:uncharacterized protein YcfJ